MNRRRDVTGKRGLFPGLSIANRSSALIVAVVGGYVLIGYEHYSSIRAVQAEISTMFVVILLSVGAFVSISLLMFSRSILRSFKRATEATSAMTAGKFDVDIEVSGLDEAGQLLEATIDLHCGSSGYSGNSQSHVLGEDHGHLR